MLPGVMLIMPLMISRHDTRVYLMPPVFFSARSARRLLTLLLYFSARCVYDALLIVHDTLMSFQRTSRAAL